MSCTALRSQITASAAGRQWAEDLFACSPGWANTTDSEQNEKEKFISTLKHRTIKFIAAQTWEEAVLWLKALHASGKLKPNDKPSCITMFLLIDLFFKITKTSFHRNTLWISLKKAPSTGKTSTTHTKKSALDGQDCNQGFYFVFEWIDSKGYVQLSIYRNKNKSACNI